MSVGSSYALVPKDDLRNLIRQYYEARRCCIAERSGDIRGDWILLSNRVEALSNNYLGESFDFDGDELIYDYD